MTLREFPWLPTSGVVRWVHGMLVTLCAVLALLVHHEISYTLDASPSAMTGHAMHAATTPVTHAQTGSSEQGRLTDDADFTACPSMVMQHCSAASVGSVQLAAPTESPAPVVSADYSSITRVDLVRSVSRAPPNLSLLSQLRI
jgi:hypothetical protein